jgi:hypothetical protein
MKNYPTILVGIQRNTTLVDQEKISLWHNLTTLNNITNNRLELPFVYKQVSIVVYKCKDWLDLCTSDAVRKIAIDLIMLINLLLLRTI